MAIRDSIQATNKLGVNRAGLGSKNSSLISSRTVFVYDGPSRLAREKLLFIYLPYCVISKSRVLQTRIGVN